MSELSITLNWQRPKHISLPTPKTNEHEIIFNDHIRFKGDAAPGWGGEAEHANPEQALASAVSSCQMMTFLALAAKAKWPVLTYRDRAVAYLGKNPQNKMAVVKLELHPEVTFDEGFSITKSALTDMHDRAHRYCFIANSLADYVETVIHSEGEEA